MYYVYILKSSKDGKLYTGHTVNLKQRLHRHNIGGVRSTKNRRPMTLIYFEKFHTREKAVEREKFLKTYRGGIEKIAIAKSAHGNRMVPIA